MKLTNNFNIKWHTMDELPKDDWTTYILIVKEDDELVLKIARHEETGWYAPSGYKVSYEDINEEEKEVCAKEKVIAWGELIQEENVSVEEK